MLQVKNLVRDKYEKGKLEAFEAQMEADALKHADIKKLIQNGDIQEVFNKHNIAGDDLNDSMTSAMDQSVGGRSAMQLRGDRTRSIPSRAKSRKKSMLLETS